MVFRIKGFILTNDNNWGERVKKKNDMKCVNSNNKIAKITYFL